MINATVIQHYGTETMQVTLLGRTPASSP